MGLSIQVNAHLNEIDPERWEAVWLTGLQLLEQFPGSLAARRVVDLKAGRRTLYSTDYIFDVGKPEEHWEVVGDLASRRTAESYQLHRHLTFYGRSSPRKKSRGRDLLWLSSPESDSHMAGTSLFGNKSQGYPYHYCMLAIGMLLECSFPKQAVVHGDINRAQAEKTLAWAEAVLQRPLALPIVTDAPRLWPRLLSAYAGDHKSAGLRFLELFSDVEDSRWQALLRLESGPDAAVLREIFRDELGHFQQLNQRGALEMIKALYQATEDLELVIDWICGDGNTGRAFAPTELLKELCDCLLTIPCEKRASLGEFLQSASNPMRNIEGVFGQVFGILAGLPIVIDAYCDRESLLAPFASHWAVRTEEFRALIHERTEHREAWLDKFNAQLDELKTRVTDLPAAASAWDPTEATALLSIPEAEFILEQIAEQRFEAGQREQVARGWGANIREVLQAPASEWIEKMSADELSSLMTKVANRTGLTLTEAAWQAIDQASRAELKSLCVLATIDDREIKFWNWRIHLLESPDLWHFLIE